MGGRQTVPSIDKGRSMTTSCFGLVLLSFTVFSKWHSSSIISGSLLQSLVSNSVVCERQTQPVRPQLQSHRPPSDGGFKKVLWVQRKYTYIIYWNIYIHIHIYIYIYLIIFIFWSFWVSDKYLTISIHFCMSMRTYSNILQTHANDLATEVNLSSIRIG